MKRRQEPRFQRSGVQRLDWAKMVNLNPPPPELSDSEEEEWIPPPMLWAPPSSYNKTTAQPPSSEVAGSSGNRPPPQLHLEEELTEEQPALTRDGPPCAHTPTHNTPSHTHTPAQEGRSGAESSITQGGGAESPAAPQDKPQTSGHSRVSANRTKKKKNSRNLVLHMNQKTSVGPRRPPAPPRGDIVGRRIRHVWKEDNVSSRWTATVLDRVAVKPSLYLLKYDGFDCIYGLELHTDERVRRLKVLPDGVAPSGVTDAMPVETMVGKHVEHIFDTKEGPKEKWRGLVLARAPVMTAWFYITYDKDPVLYMYQLLEDYREGDLRILPDSNDSRSPPAEREPGEEVDSLVGKLVEFPEEDGGKRAGMVIQQVEAKPSLYFIKFDDDFHIYVYSIKDK